MSDEQVTVSKDEYEKYKKTYDSLHSKYGDYDDEDIDNIIDMRVRQEVAKWESEIAQAQLDAAILENKQKDKQLNLDLHEACQKLVNLRETVLNDSVSIPIVMSEDEILALFRKEE